MPEAKRDCYRGQLIHPSLSAVVPVVVAPPGFWEDRSGNPVPVQAIIDTGATYSCISPLLAQFLGITPIDKKPVMTAKGSVLSNVYLVDMAVCLDTAFLSGTEEMKINFREFSRVCVMEFGGDNASTMLLGMNIITRSALEIKGNEFSLAL